MTTRNAYPLRFRVDNPVEDSVDPDLPRPTLEETHPPVVQPDPIPEPPTAPLLAAWWPKAPVAPQFPLMLPRAPIAPPFPPRVVPVMRPTVTQPVEIAPVKTQDPIVAIARPDPQVRVTPKSCDGGQPPLVPSLPPVPDGHPCYVTRDMVANDDPRTDKTPFEDKLITSISQLVHSKPRVLAKVIAQRPDLLIAAITTMSGGVWNLVDVDYGTINVPPVRLSQGYGLAVISEKWTKPLFTQAAFLIGAEMAPLLGKYPDTAPLTPYAIGPSLVRKHTAIPWVLLYLMGLDAHLGSQLQFTTTGVIPKATAGSDVRRAVAIINKVSTQDATGLWIQAWLRFGSASGCVSGIINGYVPAGTYMRNLKGLTL